MTSPRILLGSWNLHAKKERGQNFLADPSTTRMIVEKSNISPEDVILEIGSGLGALTIPAARAAAKLYAIEKDPQLIPILKAELLTAQITNAVVQKGDILAMDIAAIAQDAGRKIIVMGNLPYNISSQIIIRLISCRNSINRATLMLQKELAQRLTASPNSKAYGRLSVVMQYYAEIKPLTQVKAALFFPKPKVDSTVVRIDFRSQIPNPVKDDDLFIRVVKAAFGKRRKTLKNALTQSDLGLQVDQVLAWLAAAGIDPIRRAETLEVAEFVTLSNRYQKA
jgi:16S rRNA (adenine1518-N6/adenine1519-N6)-dimethyltransferase